VDASAWSSRWGRRTVRNTWILRTKTMRFIVFFMSIPTIYFAINYISRPDKLIALEEQNGDTDDAKQRQHINSLRVIFRRRDFELDFRHLVQWDVVCLVSEYVDSDGTYYDALSPRDPRFTQNAFFANTKRRYYDNRNHIQIRFMRDGQSHLAAIPVSHLRVRDTEIITKYAGAYSLPQNMSQCAIISNAVAKCSAFSDDRHSNTNNIKKAPRICMFGFPNQ
jgi:hypothetical protein